MFGPRLALTKAGSCNEGQNLDNSQNARCLYFLHGRDWFPKLVRERAGHSTKKGELPCRERTRPFSEFIPRGVRLKNASTLCAAPVFGIPISPPCFQTMRAQKISLLKKIPRLRKAPQPGLRAGPLS